MMHSLDLRDIARTLGGDVNGRQVLAPGPGHSAKDRSLSVTVAPHAPDGFVVFSHAGDDAIHCKDYVREKLGMDTWKPKANGANGGNGAAKPSPEKKRVVA